MSHMAKQFTGVILAAGAGRRMGAIGEALPKACLPLGHSPLIHHHLDLLRAQGVRRVVVVVGYKNEAIRDAVKSYGSPADFDSIEFVEQHKRLGIAHALLKVEGLVPENMIVILGDTYFIPDRLGEPLELFEAAGAPGLGAVLSVRKEPNPAQIRKECSIRLDAEGCLVEIKEKPQTPFNDMKPCGMYFFSNAIFDAIRQTPASELRNEVEISDSIQTLVNSGRAIRCAHTVAWDMNLNTPAELWWCNQVELRRRGGGSWVGARVELDPAAVVEDSVLGNDIQVGAGVTLSRCLVLDDTRLHEPTRYRDAVLAYGAVVEVSEADKELLPPVSDALFAGADGSLVFRCAEERDCERLFRWVNSAESLAAKVKTTAPILRDVHDRWFAKALASERTQIWILEVGSQAVGQARIERTEAGVELDIFLDAGHRRRGLALAAMHFMRTEAESRWRDAPLIARILSDNQASLRLCEKAGYAYVENCSDHLLYRLTSSAGPPQ